MKSLKTTFLTMATLAMSAVTSAQTITGAGATFPYPLYAKWADEYKKATGVMLNYQSIGSGGGIKQVKAKTVQFGATDMPLKIDELNTDGLIQFPATIGGVVPVVNVAGAAPGALKLTGPVLADIYLGKIKKWNEAPIASINPGVSLPADAITVVRRADGSGTSFLFTDFLAKVSPDWKSKVGVGTAVSWPAGVGGKGNEGVAAYVQSIKGAIGYVEFAYAKKNKLAHVQMQNADGAWVQPDDDTFAAAAANAKWDVAQGFYEILTAQPGKNSWPVTGASFILMPKAPQDAKLSAEVTKFFTWSFKQGGKFATDLDYVPLPANLIGQIESQWRATFK